MTLQGRREVHVKMKKILILCLIIAVAFSFGCSKKKAEAPKDTAAKSTSLKGDAPRKISLLDPVSRELVDLRESPYSYEYNGCLYPFANAQNMEAFKADPEKYIAALKTSPPAPATGQ